MNDRYDWGPSAANMLAMERALSGEPAGQTFAEFARQMEAILSPTAAGKGYSTTGVDGRNELYEFVQSFAGDGHALGEIVYKAKRYAAKGDPTELIKIASWAFLIWRHRDESTA